jgi:phospholipid/cholesterol/gamma-HCH transport system substrate-binding protein
MSERLRDAIVGLVVLTTFVGASVIGVSAAFGEFRPTYELTGTFAAAGQGLLPGSDVKIRGANVGEVERIELVDGRAEVTLSMDRGERVPVSVQAVIRPKTLFGEKFVDLLPGPDESTGPYLDDGGRIEDTLGGFELEKVLIDLYPILEVIDPIELATVIGTLADAGAGMGETINRQIVNLQQITAVWSARDPETRRFLADLDLLLTELDARAPDLVAGARDLNVALPELNRRGDSLAVVLDQAAALSGGLADLFEANRTFPDRAVTEGGRALQLLFDERGRVEPLVTGLRLYLQTLTEAVRIPLGDGTNLAAVKGIMGGDDLCGQGQGKSCLLPVDEPEEAPAAGPPAPAPAPGPGPLLPVPAPELPLPLPPLPQPSTGSQAVTDLIGGLLG